MAKTGQKLSKKPYLDHMELEYIIADMADAMRNAELSYVSRSGRLTSHIEGALDMYIAYAKRVNDGQI